MDTTDDHEPSDLAVDIERVADEVKEQLRPGDQIGDLVVVSRRQLIAFATGAAGVGALAQFGISEADAQSAAGQVGTSSEPVDVVSNDITTAKITDGDDGTTYDVGDDLAGGGGGSVAGYSDVLADRTDDTDYQNTTGNPLIVHVVGATVTDQDYGHVELEVGSSTTAYQIIDRGKFRSDGSPLAQGVHISVMAVVADGHYYRVGQRNMPLDHWSEQEIQIN